MHDYSNMGCWRNTNPWPKITPCTCQKAVKIDTNQDHWYAPDPQPNTEYFLVEYLDETFTPPEWNLADAVFYTREGAEDALQDFWMRERPRVVRVVRS